MERWMLPGQLLLALLGAGKLADLTGASGCYDAVFSAAFTHIVTRWVLLHLSPTRRWMLLVVCWLAPVAAVAAVPLRLPPRHPRSYFRRHARLRRLATHPALLLHAVHC